jgi:tetratricopeptide (TPR) repeat protein
VAFFANWKQKRELKRIARQVKRSLSPGPASALVEKYIDSGLLEDAEEIAKQGVGLFPFSNTVQAAQRHLKKAKYYDQLRRLIDQIKEKPSPTLYAMLAELYNELGETDRTLEVCREGIKQFPNYEGMYLIMGKIRYNRYLKEELTKDGMLAVDFFEKALAINGRDYKTLVRLGEIYIELGMRTKALEKLKSVLYFAPEDESARKLMERVQTLPPEQPLDIEECFNQLHKKRSQQEGRERRSRLSEQDIESRLWNFAEVPGILAIICTAEGARKFASRIVKKGVNEDALCVGLGEIYSAAQDSSLRMDIGSFQQGILYGSAIQVHIFRFENLVFAVTASAQAKADAIQTAIDNFIDNQLYA